MEEEKLEIEEIKSGEQWQSSQEVGESNVSVGAKGAESASSEDKRVAVEGGGGEETFLESHAVVESSGIIVEAVAETIQPLVQEEEEVVAEEACNEVITPQSGNQSLELKADERPKLAGDAKAVEVVTDAGVDTLSTESQLEAGRDELWLDPQLKMKYKEEFTPAVDEKVELAVTDTGGISHSSKLLMDAGGDELPADLQHEMQSLEVFASDVDANVEWAVDMAEVPHSSELQTDGREDELPLVSYGMETRGYQNERETADGEKIEVGGADNGLVGGSSVDYATSLVDSDMIGEEKSNVLVTDSDIGTAKKSAVIEWAKVGPTIAAEIPSNIHKAETERTSEVNAYVDNVSDGELVDEVSCDMEYLCDDAEVENTVDKEVDAPESLMPGNRITEDDNKSVEVLEGSKLDAPANMAENMTHSVVKEGLPTENVKKEVDAGVELEMTRNDVVEGIQLADAGVENETGAEVVADEIPEEDVRMEIVETRNDVDEPDLEIDDSQAPLQDEEDETMVAEEETGTQDTEIETETDVAESGKTNGGKRRRGKLSKLPSINKAVSRASSRKKVGEDVCFICFDGGQLVICDRRGCPKAYHPSCVNRDEAFFRSKGRWNCGWHLCSICEKNARYMCYTCTFSLCKSCIKDAVIFCVRGKNKGFCETCMRTIMLIENNVQENEDMQIQIDFDDRSSWEYLFKDYYLELKAKLSLSSAEIVEAKNPWKGADMSAPSKHGSSEAQGDANDGGSGSDESIENLETVRPKRRKVRKQSKTLNKEEGWVSTDGAAGDSAISLSDSSEWASKELLEFVSHMKNGDTSVVSQFDVQALLLEYIKRNKLRDPRRKSQIICDARLEILFGKPRVGHFEMLKLLESHFLTREEQNDDIQESVVDTENNQLDIGGNADSMTKGGKDKKRKPRKRTGPQSNLDDYAAIDMHNISLIYLRRKLMEDLLEDAERFHDKVVGTFVRIRISGNTQKQDLYRLVQVVGTVKAAEPYKIGKKTTDTMVEILNLDKIEIVSIDTISNQEFTEEECKRLRQSIKCGLISRLTVGEILDKTMDIQVARVNDWLESETLRLSHLRDRASDLGRRKELRECVEKLQLLKTPEERRRRLEESPEIHADPKMDPSYESDENDSDNEDSRRDAFMRSRGFSRRGRGPISPGADNSAKDYWSGAGKFATSKNVESNRNQLSSFSVSASHIGEIVSESSWNFERDRDTQESNISEKLHSASNLDSAELPMRTVPRPESSSGVTSVTSQASLSTGIVETAVKINESEKIWYYKDPSGKVQGPFSVVQLRKWNNTGYFPADLKIWRNTEKEENSILLADALVGKFPKELPTTGNVFSETNAIHDSSHILTGHTGGTSGTFLQQVKERSNTDRNSGSVSILSTKKWAPNDIGSLPSPTPNKSNTGWTGAIQSPVSNMVLKSPTAVVPNTGAHSSAPASVLSTAVETGTAFSPTPNSQPGIQVGAADSLRSQPSMASEPQSIQMHGHLLTPAQPVQTVTVQNQGETQSWGQSGQAQGYGWSTPSVPNSSGSFPNSCPAGPQSDLWGPQGGQPNMNPPATSNVPWGMVPAGNNNTPMGVRPENPGSGWGMVQSNQAMGWGNPPPGNASMNWGPTMQGPPPGNTTGWVPPSGQGHVPGTMNPGWATPQGWAAPPVQGQVPGNAWGPPSGNAGAAPPVQGPSQGNTNPGWCPPSGNPGSAPPVPGPTQGNTNQGWGPPSGNTGAGPPVPGPAQGNTNQGWGPPPSNQGPWVGDQNQGGGQFPGPVGGHGRDSGFGGGRPWNRQSSFGSGGFRKRDTICPYNANGRCKKGARCDYLHT